MSNRLITLTVFAWCGATTHVVAQHGDLLAFNTGGQVGVGEFDFDMLSETARRVFPSRLDSFYAVNDPGFTARSGPTSLPGNTNLEWDFLPMTVDSGLHDGYESTLLYWDGVGSEPVFGPTPTDDYRFSLFGKNGTAAAGGTDELVPGHNIETTSPNGSIHEHRFFFLDDNGDGLNTTLPDAGIYLFAMQLRAEGLEKSDPFFLVWSTPEASVIPAVQPATAWVNSRVDTLVVDDELLPGDFNLDGMVDAADYTVWRDGLGTTHEPADYDVWSANYGASTPSSSTTTRSVPEPTTVVSLLLACLGAAGRRRVG